MDAALHKPLGIVTLLRISLKRRNRYRQLTSS
ncbi:MAG: polyhydroxyalkanoate synthesis repressor PhaR, partial [Mesorhizobium sp.]